MNKLLAIAALVGWLQLLPNEVTVAVILILCVARFLLNLDKRPAVLEIAALIAVLQFIFAAVFMYGMGNEHHKYYMYVDEQTYFSYAIPATCCLLLGLFVSLPGTITTFKAPTPQVRLNSLGVALVIIGFLCSVTTSFVPIQLRFVFYLLAQLRYVGVLYLYFNKSPARKAATGLVCLSLIADTTRSGMFHELLLWGALLPAFYFLARPPSMKVKVLFLASVCCAVGTIQLVKHEYRELLRSGENTSIATVLLNTLAKGNAFGREWQEGLVMRVNQGWIVSAAMDHVPLRHGFANGKTIQEAVVAAIVPRVVNSNKRTATASENTEEYTGLEVWGNTSMGLSPLGESYINFGSIGGCAVMLCFGLILNAIYHWLVRLGHIDQYFLFVIPLVFLQAIKMETEFLTVLNHLTKSSILVVGLYVVFIRQPRARRHSRRTSGLKTVRSRTSRKVSRAARIRTAVR